MKINFHRKIQVNEVFLYFVLLWTLALFITYIKGAFFELEYPWNNFLNSPITRFGDFFGTNDGWVRLKFNAPGYHLIYFPGTYIIFETLNQISSNPYVNNYISQIFVFSLISIFILLVFKILGDKKTLIEKFMLIFMIYFSYPYIFAWHTGNIETYILLFLLIFTYAYLKKKYVVAGIAIGCAASIKFIPILFVLVILFITSRRDLLKSAGASIISFLSINLIALYFLPSGIRQNGFYYLSEILKNLNESRNMYFDFMVFSGSGHHFGHSLFNTYHSTFGLEDFNSIRTIYALFFAAIVLVLVYMYLSLRQIKLNKHKEELNYFIENYIFIACILCLFVPTSTDYKLLYFIPPFVVMMINELSLDLPSVILILLILVPKPYLSLSDNPFNNATNWMTTLCLLCLMFYQLRKKFNSFNVSQNYGNTFS